MKRSIAAGSVPEDVHGSSKVLHDVSREMSLNVAQALHGDDHLWSESAAVMGRSARARKERV
jgi:hypothetical protein